MKILCVEDEHRIAQSIKKGLEQEHFTVDLAYSGTNGFDLAETGDYDLIILDLMLPGLDGLEICRRLRKNNNHTPILILTAKSQVEDKVVGLDSGADDYLTKPFAFEELLARCRALSRRPRESASQVLSFEGLSLDTKTFEVTVASQSIHLSSKEFSLLEYFMRHPRQVLTKDQIIDHLWSYDRDILPNTVEVYIRNLRRKINHLSGISSPSIHTLRGFGYKLDK